MGTGLKGASKQAHTVGTMNHVQTAWHLKCCTACWGRSCTYNHGLASDGKGGGLLRGDPIARMVVVCQSARTAHTPQPAGYQANVSVFILAPLSCLCRRAKQLGRGGAL